MVDLWYIKLGDECSNMEDVGIIYYSPLTEPLFHKETIIDQRLKIAGCNDGLELPVRWERD